MKPPTDFSSLVELQAPEFFSFHRCVEAPTYVLLNLLHCSACGSLWEAAPRQRCGEPHYACANTRCSLRPRRCEDLERVVEAALTEWLGSPEAVASLEPSLRRRLAGFAADPLERFVSPADAPWMLGVAQDFCRFWRHVIPESQRTFLRVLMERILVLRDGVQIEFALQRPTAVSTALTPSIPA